MRDVNVVNEDFLTALKDISNEAERIIANTELCDWAFDEQRRMTDPTKRAEDGKDPAICAPHYDILPDYWTQQGNFYDPCGRAYLNLMKEEMSKDKHSTVTSGFPNKESFFGGKILWSSIKYDGPLRDLVYGFSRDWLNGYALALCAFYPPGGYIPWHHNGNAPGYNILMHYSWGGDGAFFTEHGGEIIEYPDKDGEWVVRAGRFLDTHGRVGGPKSQYGRLPRPSEYKDEPQAGVEDASWHSAKTSCWRLTVSTIVDSKEIWEDLIDEMEER